MSDAGEAVVPASFELAAVKFDDRGLVPVIAQEHASGEVLMLAYADREALGLTLETGRAHYYSRSRARLWRKGDDSGNVQHVLAVSLDCDGDALLYRVHQQGPACHTGQRSCFFRSRQLPGSGAARPVDQGSGAAGPVAGGELLGSSLALLEDVVTERLRSLPEGSYVARLHRRGLGYVAQKVVEEAGETVVAALQERDDELVAEAADLIFHLTVLLRERGQGLSQVLMLLESRHRATGDG